MNESTSYIHKPLLINLGNQVLPLSINPKTLRGNAILLLFLFNFWVFQAHVEVHTNIQNDDTTHIWTFIPDIQMDRKIYSYRREHKMKCSWIFSNLDCLVIPMSAYH